MLWLSLLGVMTVAMHVVKHARLRMRPILFYLLRFWTNPPQLHRKIIVPFHLIQHLAWWSDRSILRSGLPLSPPPVADVIMTDVSLTGWGGVLDGFQQVKRLWGQEHCTWLRNRYFFPSGRFHCTSRVCSITT